MHVYDAKNEAGESVKEALIKFETDSGATTACLITGALVDGHNITVELFPETIPSPGSATGAIPPTGEKPTGVAAIVSEGRHVASEVGKKVKQMDQQLGFSQGVKQVYVAGRTSVQSMGERFHVSEKASAAAEATRVKVAQIDEQLRISQRVNALGNSVASFLGIRTTPLSPGTVNPGTPIPGATNPTTARYANPPPTYSSISGPTLPSKPSPVGSEKKE